MSPFATLSSLVRAVFALWALLLTLANVANVILAVVKKRYLPTAAALVLSALSFLVWQVIFDYSLYVRSMA